MTKSKIEKSVTVKGKKWTQADIKKLLQTNEKAIIRGMLLIYDYQTADEKASQDTCHDNGMGFNGFDAKILSSFCEWYNQHGYLSQKQLEIAKKKMVKYSGQIFNHMVMVNTQENKEEK